MSGFQDLDLVLIWVVTRMQLQVNQYPIWSEVVEVDTWVGASGKNGMRRDWLNRSHVTGQTPGLMMNQQTRCLSKMPAEVRAEISPWFIEKNAIQEKTPETIKKLDNAYKYINSNLKTIPGILLEHYQLFGITLEYGRELYVYPMKIRVLQDEVQDYKNYTEQLQALELEGDSSPRRPSLNFAHLLQMTTDSKTEEIVRGRTTWNRKPLAIPRRYLQTVGTYFSQGSESLGALMKVKPNKYVS
ncbi:hypothetical protein REPUB_Repub08aG0100500 [Reevesia pubescens]